LFGICGIAALNGEQQIARELIEQMNDRIRHRGPDDCGYYMNSNVALGHRRLSIIDLSGGGQPISAENKNQQVRGGKRKARGWDKDIYS
jgi:asparagine synthase (glutamine-hydrolysing)